MALYMAGLLIDCEVVMNIDEGRAVNGVNMDFSKTFDKLTHGRLIQKIKMHRIYGDFIVWI